MADKKIKIQIVSDGTIQGTKLTVNSEKITEEQNVTSVDFSAWGGVIWADGDELGPRLNFSYRTVEQDGEGTMIGKTFTYTPNTGLERTEKPIGKPDEAVKDTLVGKKWGIITQIDSYRDKSNRHIPETAELELRSAGSLKDLLSDLEKEVGK